jgi:hypothetical protein
VTWLSYSCNPTNQMMREDVQHVGFRFLHPGGDESQTFRPGVVSSYVINITSADSKMETA